MKDTTKPFDLDEFLNSDILTLLGLDSIEPKRKQKLQEQILGTIRNRIFLRIIQELKEQGKVEDYEAIEDEDESEQFLVDNGINLANIALEESLAYKAELANMADMIDQGIDIKVKKSE